MKQEMALGNDILIKVANEVESTLPGDFVTKQPEVTPERKISLNPLNLKARQRNQLNSDHAVPSSSRSKVRKCLFPTKYPKSYKLSDIYSHLFDQPLEGAHSAESDALALLNCILKVAPDFLKYANESHKSFNSL